MSDPRVLLAEDDEAVRKAVQGVFTDAGFVVEAAQDGQDALERYQAAVAAGRNVDAVVADINMPRMDGLELLDRLKDLDPEVLVVFVTAYSSVDSAVSALRKGAYDYLTKPFRNDHLVQVVKNAVKQRALFAENRTLRREIERHYGFQEVVGRSPAMAAVFRLIERAAPSTATILIRGETGTGKELVARAAHHASDRSGKPFVSINCAALPEGLLESELFGHVKGAFSGAVADSPGLFRAAQGGTLFLDELGEMPLAIQAKLLRVLEAREVRPVGGTQSLPVDVRIVSATNKDLLAEIEAGRFREDLYYRCAVVEVEVPPLRARPDDIPLLARHFLARCAREREQPERKLAPEALAALLAYPWPGNVRELANAIEHAAVVAGDSILPADLPARVREYAAAPHEAGTAAPPLPGDETLTLAELERRHVLALLAREGGDRRRAAELLGIDLSTLYRKIKRWEEGGG